MSKAGARVIDGVNVVPVDGMWRHVADAPAEDKLSSLLDYAGCKFYDERQRYVGSRVVALLGIGGLPIAYESDSDTEIASRIQQMTEASRLMMSNSAAFSYLNVGNRSPEELYGKVANLGHHSIAHTVQANLLVAGITEASELELSLQRDLMHISKLTNARTVVQNRPPIVVQYPDHLSAIREITERTDEEASRLRQGSEANSLEIVNGLYPTSKATALMLSGTVRNMSKFAALRNDDGKEAELRGVASDVHGTLSKLWPELFSEE